MNGSSSSQTARPCCIACSRGYLQFPWLICDPSYPGSPSTTKKKDAGCQQCRVRVANCYSIGKVFPQHVTQLAELQRRADAFVAAQSSANPLREFLALKEAQQAFDGLGIQTYSRKPQTRKRKAPQPRRGPTADSGVDTEDQATETARKKRPVRGSGAKKKPAR